MHAFSFLLAIILVCIAAPSQADDRKCTTSQGVVVPCVGFGYTKNGYIHLEGVDKVSDIDYGSVSSNEVVSVKQKNSWEFTATYSDGRKSDFYIDKDESVQKGISPFSTP